MGSKIEAFILGFIIILGAFAYFIVDINLENKDTKTIEQKKETEINNFIEYELNATELFHILHASNAYKLNDIWYLKKPNITSESIQKLSSKRAIYSKDKIIFLDNVYALKEDNSTYHSQKAIYLKREDELLTPKAFQLQKNGSIVVGKKLIYKNKTQETFAKDVQAAIKLKDTK